MSVNLPLDVAAIMNCLPHRYPFLLVDRVTDLTLGEALTGYKNVTINEPFFVGHFPQQPIMPGVLVIEALAQATGILAFYSEEEAFSSGDMYYLVGVDKARFKQPIVPGDQLILDVKLNRSRRGVGVFSCEAKVDGNVAVSAELMCARRAPDEVVTK